MGKFFTKIRHIRFWANALLLVNHFDCGTTIDFHVSYMALSQEIEHIYRLITKRGKGRQSPP